MTFRHPVYFPLKIALDAQINVVIAKFTYISTQAFLLTLMSASGSAKQIPAMPHSMMVAGFRHSSPLDLAAWVCITHQI